MNLAEVYARYHNQGYGFEEHIDCNVECRSSPKGIFHHAIFLMLLDLNNSPRFYCLDKFNDDVKFIEKSPQIKQISLQKNKANIQKFNLIAYISTSYRVSMSYSDFCKRQIVLKQALKSLFRFNTTAPIDISYWCLFFYAAKKYQFAEALLFPLLAFKVLFSGKVEDNILNLLIMHSFDSKKPYTILGTLFTKKMQRKYGNNFIEVMMKLYYTDLRHPNIQYAAIEES